MNKTILIIEDEIRIRFLLRDYLIKRRILLLLKLADGEEGLICF